VVFEWVAPAQVVLEHHNLDAPAQAQQKAAVRRRSLEATRH
jgi:hypothetical protein